MEIKITPNFSNREGVIKMELANWDGYALSMSRKTFGTGDAQGLLDIAGLYIIYGDFYDKQKQSSAIYIGEGDSVLKRLKQHEKKKSFWNRVIVLHEKTLNNTDFKQIEKKFIQLAKKACRYEIDNKNKGTNVSNHNKEQVEKFVSSTKYLLSNVNIDVFDFNFDCVFSNLQSRTYDMRIKVVDSNFLVLKGSTIFFLDGRETEERVNFLEQLKSSGKLIFLNSNLFEFSQDCIFNESELILAANAIFLSTFKSSTGENLTSSS